jgi:hypothetical protein
LTWGPFEANLLKRAEKGESVPALDNKPALTRDMLLLWRAFEEIHETRNVSEGITPLLNTEIEAWLNINCVDDPWLRRDIYKAVRALDSVWRSKMSEKWRNSKS